MSNRAIYLSREEAKTEEFFDSLHSEARSESAGGALDSAASLKLSASVVASQSAEEMPACVQAVIDATPVKNRARVLDSAIQGMEIYRQHHGVLPTADVLAAAMQQGLVAGRRIDSNGRVFDGVGGSAHHDNFAAEPNRIIVAITSAIAEAIPFATYLPTDVGSNQARLGIVSHQSGSLFGDYKQGELMDGVSIGKSFFAAERRIEMTVDAARTAATGAVYAANDGSMTPVAVLRGRTNVFVNGFPVASESSNVGSGVANSPISGVATINGVDHVVGGVVTIATGAVDLTFAPALPASALVEAELYIDYEAQPNLSPEMIAQVQTFNLYATPWRARTRQTIDSKTQYQNEIGVDLQSETLIAVRNQFAMERHYMALSKLKALAVNNAEVYDFGYATQSLQKTRAQIWQDFSAVLGIVDQRMAEDTMEHGVTHLYVTRNVAAQMMSLPRELFVSSGISARPSIYRIGTLFGRFEVYYTPKILAETATGSQILFIGRSPQVARCPLVLGDAVAPTYMPLSFGDDMKSGSAFYGRNFTQVNPHKPSASGAALITVSNLF